MFNIESLWFPKNSIFRPPVYKWPTSLTQFHPLHSFFFHLLLATKTSPMNCSNQRKIPNRVSFLRFFHKHSSSRARFFVRPAKNFGNGIRTGDNEISGGSTVSACNCRGGIENKGLNYVRGGILFVADACGITITAEIYTRWALFCRKKKTNEYRCVQKSYIVEGKYCTSELHTS